MSQRFGVEPRESPPVLETEGAIRVQFRQQEISGQIVAASALIFVLAIWFTVSPFILDYAWPDFLRGNGPLHATALMFGPLIAGLAVAYAFWGYPFKWLGWLLTAAGIWLVVAAFLFANAPVSGNTITLPPFNDDFWPFWSTLAVGLAITVLALWATRVSYAWGARIEQQRIDRVTLTPPTTATVKEHEFQPIRVFHARQRRATIVKWVSGASALVGLWLLISAFALGVNNAIVPMPGANLLAGVVVVLAGLFRFLGGPAGASLSWINLGVGAWVFVSAWVFTTPCVLGPEFPQPNLGTAPIVVPGVPPGGVVGGGVPAGLAGTDAFAGADWVPCAAFPGVFNFVPATGGPAALLGAFQAGGGDFFEVGDVGTAFWNQIIVGAVIFGLSALALAAGGWGSTWGEHEQRQAAYTACAREEDTVAERRRFFERGVLRPPRRVRAVRPAPPPPHATPIRVQPVRRHHPGQVRVASAITFLAGLWLIIAPWWLDFALLRALATTDVLLGIVVALIAAMLVVGAYKAPFLAAIQAFAGMWAFAAAFAYSGFGLPGFFHEPFEIAPQIFWSNLVPGIVIFVASMWAILAGLGYHGALLADEGP